MTEPFLLNRVRLCLRPGAGALLENLSAVTLASDGSLWLGSDELSRLGNEELNTIDRLSPVEPYVFGDHQSFALRDFIDIPDELGEVDIEGMDYANSYLWLAGSHSGKRKKPKDTGNLDENLQRLTRVDIDPNRYLIARIPVVAGQPYKSCPDPNQPDRQLTAAILKQKKQGNQLTKALETDEHLGSYILGMLPSKENGFDIEGLAVYGNKLFLGLRGPVLRGWAIVLEIELKEAKSGRLKLKALDKTEQFYWKHFLQLDGLGIRDLCFRGDDLLILAGPTMDLAGILRLYCWRNVLNHSTGTICEQVPGQLELLFELPYSSTGDKAEGLVLLPSLGESCAALVVYDSPHPDRVMGTDTVFADVFRLPA